MSGRTILLFFTLCTAIAVSLYKHKGTKQVHELDRVRSGLRAIDSILPLDAHISFKCPPSQIELFMWSRYILAPRYLAYNEERDTMLSIHFLKNGDSFLNGYNSSYRVLYKSEDDKYLYLLTAKQMLQ